VGVIGVANRFNGYDKEIGIEAFIMKPFSKNDITKTIPQVLDKTKGTDQ